MNRYKMRAIIGFVNEHAPRHVPIIDQMKCVGLEELLTTEEQLQVFTELRQMREAEEIIDKLRHRERWI